MKKYLIALLISCIILLLCVCNKAAFTNYPTDKCDLARLNTGRWDGSLGSILEPTTLTYDETIKYFSDNDPIHPYPTGEMAARRSGDNLIHAGWINHTLPGENLVNSDRWNNGYKYQVGSSIQVL